ncbi:Ig-like domain-containing protein [Diaminobutyricibacter sp. McL0618]|uniref:Ig-like domain-containing protein n=1 Tax=Leifsonia sp. McL0618 TaxID=3415677 RepID=UPI003CF30CDB
MSATILALIAVTAVASVVGLAAAVVVASPARADALRTEVTPTATPAPGAPSITSPARGTLVTTGSVEVEGTGAPGDDIQVFVDAHGPACEATVDTASAWSCTVPTLSDGPDVIISAVVAANTDRADSVSVAVLSPPTVAGGSNGFLSSGGLHGTGYPGATVTVTTSGGATCTFPVDANGSWACVLSGPPPSGTYSVSATQRAPFSTQSSRAGTPVDITIDSAAPARPGLVAPTPNTTVPLGRAAAFRGTGETGARITVYGGDDAGSAVICRATVAQGAWACAGVLPAGRYTVSALQTDASGNVSPASAAVSVTFAAASAPSSSAPTVPSGSSPSRSPGHETQAVPSAPSTTPPPSARPPHATHGGIETWAGASHFTDATPPTITPGTVPGWLRSLLLAAAALLLLALPARLLATTVARARAEHGASARPRFFGRNRPRAELEPDGPDAHPPGLLQRRLVAGSAYVAAAALITLSSPVGDGTTYLRVLVAVLIALVVVNAAWLAVPRFASVHLTGSRARLVFQPQSLLTVAVAAIASRMLDLQPALLFGVLVGAIATPAASRAAHGRLAAAQVAGLAGVGVLAWLALGPIPEPSGPFSAFGTDLAQAVTLLAIGSAAISLIPVGGLAGRAIFLWSRRVWGALSLAVYTVLFALLLPVASLWNAGNASILLVVGVLAFASLSVAVWLWERFVEPARQS